MAKPILIQLREASAALEGKQAEVIRKAVRGYGFSEEDSAELDRLLAEFKQIATEATKK